MIAPLGAIALAVGAAAVVTRGFGFASAPSASSAQEMAQQRCQNDVQTAMVSPAATAFSDVRSARSELEPESSDLFRLMLDDRLKAAARADITVWEVTGVATVPNEVGGEISDRFSCRAYFVGDDLVDTLVSSGHAY